MSRMTKFLRQTCSVETYQLNEAGQPSHNAYGELLYNPPVTLKCRHEVAYKDIQTANGQLVRSTSRYFLDDVTEIKADYRIDGRVVLNVASYINGLGKCEGYEVYV